MFAVIRKKEGNTACRVRDFGSNVVSVFVVALYFSDAISSIDTDRLPTWYSD